MRVLVALALLLLSACSYQQAFDRVSTAQEQALALQAAQAVQKGDTAWFTVHAGDLLKADLTPALIRKMQLMSPPGKPVLAAVNWQSLRNGDQAMTFKRFTYEIGADGKWALLEVVLETERPTPMVNGVFVRQADRSLIAANRLTLEGKGPLHFLWLGLMAAAVGTSLTAFVLAIRTRGLRWKWLWCVGTLFSVAMFQLDWTTGAWRVLPISFLFLGASAFQQGALSPWVMSFAIPGVAIAFLVLRAVGELPTRPADDQPIGTP